MSFKDLLAETTFVKEYNRKCGCHFTKEIASLAAKANISAQETVDGQLLSTCSFMLSSLHNF